MRLKGLKWSEQQVAHIGRHGVSVREFEQVCRSPARVVFRARSEGPSPVFNVFGQTADGRHLFCVVIRFADGNGYPVTAREMTEREKRRYRKWLK
jgi:uncharacterized protein